MICLSQNNRLPEAAAKIAFLNLKGHPRGNAILKILRGSSYSPGLIIEEDSGLASKGRSFFLNEFENVGYDKLVLDVDKDPQSTQIIVDNHNGMECERALKIFCPDLIVLGDTRVILKNIIDIPKLGILNVHPGYLPDVRGNNPYIWSVYHGLPCGCSVHLIDEDIDMGPVIFREKIDPTKFTSFADYLLEINRRCAALALDAVSSMIEGKVIPVPQSKLSYESNYFPEFKLAPQHIRARVKNRFLLHKTKLDTK